MRFICQKLGRGGILWTKDYQWHRSDGPAYRYPDGTEHWWKDNRLWPDQERRWWERRR